MRSFELLDLDVPEAEAGSSVTFSDKANRFSCPLS